jgi:ubiquinone/menaquinone biosynthesis C-methylase UbiE
MNDPEVSTRMREEWNARAREDAGYYVAFGRREQSEAEFFATATPVINNLEYELKRVAPKDRTNWRALEVGCGPGRLMRPMSRHFAEIHGIDVSDEMIALAREKLRDIPNAHVHLGDGSRLGMFEDETFNFVYSYAVFQHIPSREVVMEYLREVHRVLVPGGYARLQLNGLPRSLDERYTTWAGARFTGMEITEFAQAHDLQILSLEGVSTQYLWTTWRKHAPGWSAAQLAREFPEPPSSILRFTNASSMEPVVPSRGQFASVSMWVENLPPEAGLQHLRVMIGDAIGSAIRITPPLSPGLQQIVVWLPEFEATGLLPVNLMWRDHLLAAPSTLRVIPPGPSVPRFCRLADAINLEAGARIETRYVKMHLEDIARPHDIEATVNGLPVLNLEYLCVDPRPQLFEVNFRLPDELGPGEYPLEVRLGHRLLAHVPLQVVA